MGFAFACSAVTQPHPAPRWRIRHLSMIVVAVVTDRAEAIDVLAGFRERFYRCLNRRADALFELTEALLCTDGPVKTLVGLVPRSGAPAWPRRHV